MGDPDEGGEDEKTGYRVNIPIYNVETEGRITTAENLSEDPSLIYRIVDCLSDLDEVRYKTSQIHLNSALFFADEAKRIEEILIGKPDQSDGESKPRFDTRIPIGNRHDVYVVNSITSSLSFLEAAINEFYDSHLEVINGESKRIDGADNTIENESFYELIENLEEIEDRDFERLPVLKKYQRLLAFADKSPFDQGREPYQSAYLLKEWRNRLVHAEVEWVDLDEEGEPSFAKSLEGKFKKNPIDPDLPFPRPYLSYDCSKWCIESAFEFVEEFYNRMGLELPSHIKGRMDDLWEFDSLIRAEETDDKES
ncbi:hypothetical protein [Natrinema sp. JCM 9743]